MGKTIAFIPVRGGSKSIPLKNIKLMNGRPLVYWGIEAASLCSYIDEVIIATDSVEITDTVNNFNFSKVKVVGRSIESATDTASTEFAMLEFAQKYDFDDIVLIQATSPLLSTTDLDKGFEILKRGEADSVLSVVRQKRFIWSEHGDFVEPLNYNINSRPRRQEFDGYLVENGAFYITSKKRLLESKCRLSGRIKAVEMSGNSYYEVDDPDDWIIIEDIMKKMDKK